MSLSSSQQTINRDILEQAIETLENKQKKMIKFFADDKPSHLLEALETYNYLDITIELLRDKLNN